MKIFNFLTHYVDSNSARARAQSHVQSSPQDSKDFELIQKYIKSNILPCEIFNKEDKQIGEITSGTFGPSVKTPIAMG